MHLWCSSQADSALPCLQLGSFPALCRKSRGRISILGAPNQETHHITKVGSTDNFVENNTCTIRLARKLNTRAPSIIIIALKALCFVWSTCPLFLPSSPGPGRMRTMRTEMLKKVTETREMHDSTKVSCVYNLSYICSRTKNPKQSNQTHPMLIFLILTPPACFSPL